MVAAEVAVLPYKQTKDMLILVWAGFVLDDDWGEEICLMSYGYSKPPDKVAMLAVETAGSTDVISIKAQTLFLETKTATEEYQDIPGLVCTGLGDFQVPKIDYTDTAQWKYFPGCVFRPFCTTVGASNTLTVYMKFIWNNL